VCHDCWKQWSNTSTTISVAEPQISPQELLVQRKMNYDKLQAILTPVWVKINQANLWGKHFTI
jgi:hypothetical protein